MASHVYILAHATRPRFKVGKANDILSRSKSFGWDDIDFTRSFGLELVSEDAAMNLERVLLRTFAAWRLPSDEVRSEGGSADGSSEWLRDACRQRLERFLDEAKDLFPHLQRHGHELAEELRRRLAPSQSEIERARRREEKQATAAAKQAVREASARFAADDLERALNEVAPKLMAELTRQVERGSVVGICEDDSCLDIVMVGTGKLEDEIWRLGPCESRYEWVNGAGSLVHGTAGIEVQNAQVVRATLGLGTRRTGLRERIFRPHIELLHSLPRIERPYLDAVFGPGFIFDEDSHGTRVAAAGALVAMYRKGDPPTGPSRSWPAQLGSAVQG